MKTVEKEDEIIVKFDGKQVKYSKSEWTGKDSFLTSEGVVNLEEWKIDLVENYGVDLDEIRS